MADELKYFELIENYVEGRLNQEEASSFEARLAIDEELRRELDIYHAIIEGIKTQGREELRLEFSSIDRELDRRTLKPFNKTAFALAASLVIVLSVVGYYLIQRKNKLPLLADKYYEKEKGLPVTMAAEESPYNELMNLYKTAKYDEALNKLNSLSISKPKNDTLLYFDGVINYELKNISQAQKSFSELSSNSSFYDRAQFRLVLTYLKEGDKLNALSELKTALKNRNSIYFEKLQALEKELVEQK